MNYSKLQKPATATASESIIIVNNELITFLNSLNFSGTTRRVHANTVDGVQLTVFEHASLSVGQRRALRLQTHTSPQGHEVKRIILSLDAFGGVGLTERNTFEAVLDAILWAAPDQNWLTQLVYDAFGVGDDADAPAYNAPPASFAHEVLIDPVTHTITTFRVPVTAELLKSLEILPFSGIEGRWAGARINGEWGGWLRVYAPDALEEGTERVLKLQVRLTEQGMLTRRALICEVPHPLLLETMPRLSDAWGAHCLVAFARGRAVRHLRRGRSRTRNCALRRFRHHRRKRG